MNRTIFLAIALVACTLAACKESDSVNEQPAQQAISVLDDFKVVEGDSSLVFQYFAGTGPPQVARTVQEVPEEARENVIVLSTAFKRGDLPPELVIVANLSSKLDDDTYPYRLVSRYDLGRSAKAAQPPAGAEPGVSHQESGIILFTTPW